jgi:pyruvate kinase
MRRTKMVFTLGPATDQPGVLAALVRAGMDCARFNFSHGAYAEHARRFRALRAEARRQGAAVAVLMDLAGPKLRVGRLAGGKLTLTRGQTVRLSPDVRLGKDGVIPISYAGLAKDVRPGEPLLLDDGLLEMTVLRATNRELLCRVKTGGLLRDHKGLNVPGVALSVPALTPKDLRDLRFGLALGVDYVGLSFVRRPEEIVQLRRHIQRSGHEARIIAKIEKPQAIAHLDAIICAADGVMVARGDLGVEMTPELVPPLQKRIIALANSRGRLVITATQMLQSMMDNPMPTRAEASDVANAIFDGSDAVMLSGETAAGRYPKEAALMMGRIIAEAEASPEYNRLSAPAQVLGVDDALVASAVELADTLRAKALVVFTQTGGAAELVSRRRPRVPLVAFARDARVQRRLCPVWGVRSLTTLHKPETEAVLRAVEQGLLEQRIVHPGDTVVVLASSPVSNRSHLNFLKIQKIKG